MRHHGGVEHDCDPATLSLMAANGVTEPGSTPSRSRISSAEPKEKRPDRPEPAMQRSSTRSPRPPAPPPGTPRPSCRARNRFLVCAPGIVPRRPVRLSTVNSGGCADRLVGDAETCPDRRIARPALQASQPFISRGMRFAGCKAGALCHSFAAVRLAIGRRLTLLGCGCSSGVEHNLAKVGVEGSNPFARSNFHKRLS